MVDGSPQVEEGYTRIANELLEAIIGFDFSKRELKILFALMRKTYGWGRSSDRIALSQFELLTGLKKNHISTTLANLIRIKVVLKQDYQYSLNKKYTEWICIKNSPKTGLIPKQDQSQNRTKSSPNLGEGQSQNRHKSSHKTVTTKEKKETKQKKIKK